jgi:alkylhydroperoxidase/carboxymuconolactone decarboxylase family protein YurZ
MGRLFPLDERNGGLVDPLGEQFTRELDAKTRALVCLAAHVALGGSDDVYDGAVETAITSGASPDEIIGVLYAVAPAVGAARVVSAAPHLASAMGYDIDRALEYLSGNESETTGLP